MVFCLSTIVLAGSLIQDFPRERENREFATAYARFARTDWNGRTTDVPRPESFLATEGVVDRYHVRKGFINFTFLLPDGRLGLAFMEDSPEVDATKPISAGAERATGMVRWLTGYSASILDSKESAEDWKFRVIPEVHGIPIDAVYGVTVHRASGWIRLLYTPVHPLPIIPQQVTRARSKEQTNAAATQELFRRFNVGSLIEYLPAYTCFTRVRALTAKPNAAFSLMNEEELVRARRGEAFLVDKYAFSDGENPEAVYTAQVDAVTGRVLMVADVSAPSQLRGEPKKTVAPKPTLLMHTLGTRHRFLRCKGSLEPSTAPKSFTPIGTITACGVGHSVVLGVGKDGNVARSKSGRTTVWYRLDQSLRKAALDLVAP